jgi:hypothetical protein
MYNVVYKKNVVMQSLWWFLLSRYTSNFVKKSPQQRAEYHLVIVNV